MSTLVIIDYQNLYKACENKIPIEQVFEEIERWAAERGGLTEIRLFVPNYQDSTPWRIMRNLQLRYGLSIEVCPVLREREDDTEAFGRRNFWKDLVDLSVYQWLTKYVHPGCGPDTIAFVTGDGDFVLAANEAKRRNKRPEFWGVTKGNNTSGAILKNFTFRELEVRENTFLFTEENPFILALNAAVEGQPLDQNWQESLRVLKSTVNGVLPALGETDVTLERKIETVAEQIQTSLGIVLEDARRIVQTLLVTGVIKITPITTQSCFVDTSSFLYQWICSADAP